jgi:hypothetical protein
MKSVEWKTYRTRFLVQAKQLNSALSFVDPLGRQHCGRKGDYLVESSEGVLSITPRRIFEDIYVPMAVSKTQEKISATQLDQLPVETLEVEEVKPLTLRSEVVQSFVREPLLRESALRALRSAENVNRESRAELTGRERRKLPQPCRDRRNPASPSRLRLM